MRSSFSVIPAGIMTFDLCRSYGVGIMQLALTCAQAAGSLH